MKAIHLTAYGNRAQDLRLVEVSEPETPSAGVAGGGMPAERASTSNQDASRHTPWWKVTSRLKRRRKNACNSDLVVWESNRRPRID